MSLTLRRRPRYVVDLPEDVILSVQEVSRSAAEPEPDLPDWAKKVLPKSGLAGRRRGGPDAEESDDPDDEEDDFSEEERGPLHTISFDLRRGEGLGIVGTDSDARGGLLRILTGGLPPSTGRVILRGRVAPILRRDMIRLTGIELDRGAVMLVGKYMHWPLGLIKSRWDEIVEFAHLEELENMNQRRRDIFSTVRLLFSASLHMDASLYVVDHGIQYDKAFGVRCIELIEQRKREGAAIVQSAQKMVEDVARLCENVIWLEGGGVTFEGRPVEVAAAVEKAQREEVHVLADPVLVNLLDGSETVEVGPDAGVIDIELHVMRKNLEIGIAIELQDDNGRGMRFDNPDRLSTESAGVYRLRMNIPPGMLGDNTYSAKVIGEIAVIGSDPAAPRDLLEFDVTSRGLEAVDDELAPSFELWAEPEAIEEDDDSGPDEVEWDVRRERT